MQDILRVSRHSVCTKCHPSSFFLLLLNNYSFFIPLFGLLYLVFNLKEHSEALASVPPLTSLADSPRVSLSLLLAAREDQSFIQPIKAGRSTQVYKVQYKPSL